MICQRACASLMALLLTALPGCEKPRKQPSAAHSCMTQQPPTSNDGAGSPKRFTISQASELIKARYASKSVRKRWGIKLVSRELTNDELWNRMQAQVFHIGGIEGAYLIRGDEILELGESFGGPGLISYCVTDLDSDGAAELVFSYGFGSGYYHCCIAAYCPNELVPHICEAPFAYHGEADLILQKIDDQRVLLRLFEWPSVELPEEVYLDFFHFLPQDEPPGLGELPLFGRVALRWTEFGPEPVIFPECDLPDDVRSEIGKGGRRASSAGLHRNVPQ